MPALLRQPPGGTTPAPRPIAQWLVGKSPGASVEVATCSPREAYADWPPTKAASSPWPLEP